MRATHFLSGLLLVLVTACGVGPAEPITDDLSQEKADGFKFARELDPQPLIVNGQNNGQFDPARYAAYTFEVETPGRFVFYSSFSVPQNLSNFFWGTSYASALDVFRLNEEAASDRPEDKWMLLSSQSNNSNLGATYLALDAFTPGTYLLVLLGTPATYEKEVDFSLQSYRAQELPAASPGNLSLTVIRDPNGRPGSGLLVAVGAVSGITDQEGRVLLEQVEPGTLEIKLGPDGLGRAQEKQIKVLGDGLRQEMVLLVDEDHYQKWLAQSDAD